MPRPEAQAEYVTDDRTSLEFDLTGHAKLPFSFKYLHHFNPMQW